MQVRSIKTNYFLSLLRIVSTTVIGVFTMPYINKALGPGSLGKVEYINSIVSYFILFSALGIPVYGIRQISKVRDNPSKLSKNLLEILGILLVSSILAYVVLFSIFLNLKEFVNYKELILIMSSMIILNNLGAEWFFQGIEDQLYITIRHVAIRVLTVILLFLCVKGPDDYIWYAVIVILNFCGSNFLNFIRLRKYIDYSHLDLKNLNFKRHLRPALTIFIASISVSIYLQIDNFLLGYLAGDKYVGYYSVANKLLRYVITFVVTIGSVLLPRLSNLWVTDKDSYYEYLRKSFSFLVLISFPCSLFFYFFSDAIIFFMAGNEFKDAALTLKILSPICLLVSIAYFFGYLVLYTQGKEKLYTISVAFSAIVSIFINYFLIQKFFQNGAALTQIICEFLGVFLLIVFIVKNKMMVHNLFNQNLNKVLLANILYFIFLYFIFNSLQVNILVSFAYTIGYIMISFGVYFILLVLLKEKNTANFIEIIKIKSRQFLR